VWRDRGGAAVAERGRVGQFGAPPGPTGAGEAVRGAFGGGDGACGSNARERSGRKKGRGRVLYPFMFVGSNTSADEHKQVGLCGGRGALYSSATRRT
jgi:hypothetical protein